MLLDDNGLVIRPAPAPIPNGPTAVADVLAHALRERPDHEALVGRHNRYTFRALDRMADAAAVALHRCGIEPGDRVAASLPNQCEIVIAYLGAMRLGAVWVGINMALAPPEKLYMLADSDARLFITTPAIRDSLVDSQCRVVVVDPNDGTGEWPDLVASAHNCDPPRPTIDPHAPAAISYTSGTTGFPKGAVHSQHNMLWQGAAARETDPGPSDERHGVLLPLTLLNLMVLGPLFAWLKDTTCICIDRVDAVGLRDWLRDERITRVTFAPPIVYDLLNHPAVTAADIASLRRPECGGAATPHSLRTLFVERFGTAMLTGYGLTEAPGGLTREMPNDPLLAGCSGKALTPIEVVIVDEHDQPLPSGAEGEICAGAVHDGAWAGVYTPFLGYWRRPEATQRALRGGLLHTDDIGELDRDGRLFVKDRRTDLIVRGGANVYPAEVERILADHPAVAACAVLGLEDERLGQRVAAVVQMRPDRVISSDDLTSYCRERVARYKVPERWLFVEQFERTPMGKIRKGDLRVLFDSPGGRLKGGATILRGMTEPPWQTIPQLIDDAAERYPTIDALVEGDVCLNYVEFRDHIDEAARALMARGVDKGDRIAIWAPNIWEWPIAALAVHRAGAIVVPINTRFKGREAGYVLQKSKAKMLFTVTDFLDTNYVALLRDAQLELPDLEQIVVFRGPQPAGTISFDDFLAPASSISAAELRQRSDSVTGDDLCHIMFTSGTTGVPKGAMLIHRAICKGYDAWCEVIGMRPGDRYLIINPYFHSFGFNSGILACLMRGATNLPHAVFDVPAVMRRVPIDRITFLPGPPAIYQTILNHPDLDKFDMSTLRLCVTGAAAIPVEMIYQMRERLGFETIVTGYGLTETSGIVTMCRHDDDPETIARTSGRAVPDIEVKVVDDDNNEVPRGEPGEVVVRGYVVMNGYLDDPEQTAETIDPDGWLHTGDIAVMDERGYVQITDRKKDMYIVGGFNAYPAEIENLMLAHPQIGGVAVVGVPDARMGEVGMAFVIPRPHTKPEPSEIIAWCREQMANYKVPRYVEVVDAFPLNPSGKVLKYELRERGKKVLASTNPK